ncbi:MAG: nicotinate phosphoribosyltransferase, partial [Acidimicrobiales bacterium]
TFEVFTRGLPPRRRYGVFAGLGRFLDALDTFRFGPAEIAWLESREIVSDSTLDWLEGFRFGGDIDAYAEGDLYAPGSPVLTVESTFGEAVLLETLVLSILNHDSAVAAAASLIVEAAGGRPVIEMGSRRTDPESAVAAARAAYLAGFASTSNLEAGRRYGVPTAGTSSHAFVLSFPDEEAAFAAQVAAFGPATTLLVDTFDPGEGIRRAVAAAGPALAAVRIDSGDLAEEARTARALLDSLGAHHTKVIVTGDLDDVKIRALTAAPADGYGAGTSVVTGLGHPTAGLVYKLVSVDGAPVAKQSPGKATVGGRKWAWRVAPRGEDVVGTYPADAPEGGRLLQARVVAGGKRLGGPTLADSRAFHQQVLSEHPPGRPLAAAPSGRAPRA